MKAGLVLMLDVSQYINRLSCGLLIVYSYGYDDRLFAVISVSAYVYLV